MSIEVRGVHKAFGDRVILDNVSLVVEEGETLAVIGYSGVGKSVLLKSIVRLLEPDAGDVFVDGQHVKALSREELYDLRRRIGYVFQFAALLDSMTVRGTAVAPSGPGAVGDTAACGAGDRDACETQNKPPKTVALPMTRAVRSMGLSR